MIQDARGAPLHWDDLLLSHVDLHVHVGTERPLNQTVRAVIDFLVATGRRVIGTTDHWGRFLGLSKAPLNHYPGTLDGFRQLAGEVAAAGELHPEAIVLFGPEISLEHLRDGRADTAFALSEVTYFLGEPTEGRGDQPYGDYLVAGIEAIARLRDRTGRPGILAHPLRASVNRYAGKTGPGPQHPSHPPFPPLASHVDRRAHVEHVFDIDIGCLAAASMRHDVPLEINEASWGRILGMNHESLAERYLWFYRALLDEGAPVVLGSDLHNVELGAPTAFIPAQMIGLHPQQMTILRHWLGGPSSRAASHQPSVG